MFALLQFCNVIFRAFESTLLEKARFWTIALGIFATDWFVSYLVERKVQMGQNMTIDPSQRQK